MATGTVGTTARKYHTSQVHYLRKAISFEDGDAAVVEVGIIPAGAVVIGGGVQISTAFNAATTNTVDIGTEADPDGFASALALGTVGLVLHDAMATSDDLAPTVDTTIVATLALTGTAPTTGAGTVFVTYLADNG